MIPVTLSSHRPPQQPLELPTFIFLCGAQDEELQQIIIEELSKETLSIFPESFESHLQEAAISLTWCGVWPPHPQDKNIFGFTLSEFTDEIKSWLTQRFGPDALGMISLAAAKRNIDLAGNFLYFDLKTQEEAMPFVTHFGATNCLFVVQQHTTFDLTKIQKIAEEQGEAFHYVSGWTTTAELILFLKDRQNSRPQHYSEGSAL